MSLVDGDWLLDDRYEIGDVIGRGGMGEVRRAHDRRLHRDVAVKFLRPDLAAQPTARQRFEDEAHSAARLTHPNVVLVLDSGEHDDTPYLVMECLPGRTLKDEIREGPLDPDRVGWIAQDVLAGLAAAHAIGIVHRDVSPGNILLTETGRAKIGDFGIAKAAESQSVTVVGQVLGTPAYVAPERLRGEPATAASDVYGFGATLYEALSGTPPFTGDTAIAIAQQAVSSRPEPLVTARPDAPAELVSAIERAMDPDPSRRPTADELHADLAGDSDLAAETAAVPVTDADAEPATMAIGAVGVAAATQTVAQPAVVPAAVRVRHGWNERRAVLVTVALVAALGLLLLALTDHSAGQEAPAKVDETTAPSTAVTAPPTTAAQVRVVVTAPPAPVKRTVRGGKGKHGKD